MTERRTGSARSKDGTSIGWYETGEGPPLVLVHGTTAEHSRWATVIDPLSARYKVHAVDRRGRGVSGDTEPYSIEREFEDVAAVVDAIDGPVNLLGHSYGAICSLEAALLTSNLRALILYEPPLPLGGPPHVSDETMQRIDALIEAGERDEALVTFMREVVRMPPEMLDHIRSLPAWQARITLAHTMTREQRLEREYTFDPSRFERMEVQTLLMLGGESPPMFSDAVATLEKTLPNARTVVMPGQQHAAMDLAPEMFVREVLDFLDAQ